MVFLVVVEYVAIVVFVYVMAVICWREFFSSWRKFRWFIATVLLMLVCFYYGYWQSTKFSETGKPQTRGKLLP